MHPLAAPPHAPLAGRGWRGVAEASDPQARRRQSRPWRVEDEAVVLADYLERASAQRLALRLQAEAIAAEVWDPARAATLLGEDQPPIGPVVVVRRADHRRALVLARLFAEVDAGTSRVAPPPQDFWHGPADRQLLGAGLVMLLVFALAILLTAAAAV